MVEIIKKGVTKPQKSVEMESDLKEILTIKCLILTSKACSGLKFSPQPPCLNFSKHSGKLFFKLTFDHFWPLCNIKNNIFAIFHSRELKFSPQTPCLIFLKTQWSNFFKLTYDHFWPLCNIKNTRFALFHASKLKFSTQNPCLIFFITQWSIFFQIDIWPFLTTVQHQK